MASGRVLSRTTQTGVDTGSPEARKVVSSTNRERPRSATFVARHEDNPLQAGSPQVRDRPPPCAGDHQQQDPEVALETGPSPTSMSASVATSRTPARRRLLAGTASPCPRPGRRRPGGLGGHGPRDAEGTAMSWPWTMASISRLSGFVILGMVRAAASRRS